MKFIDKNDLESKHDDCPLVDMDSDAVDRDKINKAVKIAKECISASFKLGLNERAFGMREILEIFEENIKE